MAPPHWVRGLVLSSHELQLSSFWELGELPDYRAVGADDVDNRVE